MVVPSPGLKGLYLICIPLTYPYTKRRCETLTTFKAFLASYTDLGTPIVLLMWLEDKRTMLRLLEA